MTLVFSTAQALLAAKAGATYVSPFVGRLDDISLQGMDLVSDIMTIYRNYGYRTEVIVASIRNTIHVSQSALIGADIITVPFKVFNTLVKHEKLLAPIANFSGDTLTRQDYSAPAPTLTEFHQAADAISSLVQRIILGRVYGIMQEALGWPARTTVKETVAAGRELVRPELCGEAILTVGGPVHEHREGLIDAVVNVGPLECMPSKIAEAFGAVGLTASKKEEVPKVVEQMLAEKRCCVVDFQVEREENVWPMVATGKGLHEMAGLPTDTSERV